ncbi:Pentatricopeptide repeat-containing protein At4g02750 [Linum perenne]
MKGSLLSVGGKASYVYSQNLKITHYGRTGRIDEAVKVFSQLSLDNAYKLFNEMPQRDLFSFTLMITVYTRNGELERARKVFNLLGSDDKKDPACWNALIAGYAKKRRFDEAKRLLDEMPVKNLVSWNSMLAGYTKNGEMELGMQFFEQMEVRDAVSYNLMVDGYVEVGELDSAWKLFREIREPNVVSWVTMISGFARSGKVSEARRLFEQIPCRNVFFCNAMLSAYTQNRYLEEAEKLFRDMTERDSVSWTIMIGGYGNVGKLIEARELLKKMPFRYIQAQTAMINAYVQNNEMDKASEIFSSLRNPDVVCWNTMISGYAQHQRMDEAFHLFQKMVNKDLVTWNTMIRGYAQAGLMDRALGIFEEMRNRNLVSWNSLISGYTQNDMHLEALKSFSLMVRHGWKQDQSTFASALSSCASIAALQLGRQLHQLVMKSGFTADLFVSNGLITTYSKCGRILEAELVFKGISSPDLVSWNSLIGGYALNGYGNEALELFNKMKLNGVVPDTVTFTGTLSACVHGGLVDLGLKLFNSMTEVYSLKPLPEHYGCLIDLLGRVGQLDVAFKLINGAKSESNAGVWGALLGACKTYRNLELGKVASEKLTELEPHKSSSQVLLSSIQAETGRWDEVQEVRGLMKDKQPGCSWIEVRNQVECFLSASSSQPRLADTTGVLKALAAEMRSTSQMTIMKDLVWQQPTTTPDMATYTVSHPDPCQDSSISTKVKDSKFDYMDDEHIVFQDDSFDAELSGQEAAN